ncbi:ABC-type glycerol-3-phosphate transport system, substrate-binding protein [Lentzea waywayandensis]|uniref:ABC-type glycerol-3-phosphate transport system, substrate-binding protein n=1 Tax=Lentzea waywayandensis TaxID=84724 RepID=A0A1I6F7S2_9PSEU|nr:extracellular solute-binding protein [Lentzea waywayandensis]SFR25912.1 ABC-type glycerol-3-phosphate transport system, substrate-binding protein [Lentzea waywayandensis]
MKSSRISAVVLTTALAVTGCAGGEPEGSGGRLALTVAIDPGLEKGAVDAFNARVAEFEKAHPDVDVQPQEYKWDATTFTAQLAGGTLPAVFTAPFTDGRGLIERRQIADISGEVAKLPYAKGFNASVAKAGQAADGAMQAVPIAAYGQALHYNRTLFTQAGLDPDKPPATWAEVRSAAKQIAERTGQAGYAQMTAGNTGGWILATLDYAFGGRVEQLSGDSAKSTLNTDEMRAVLKSLQDMRWADNSMGANFLYDWATINQDFAAGRIGMYVSGGGNYGSLKAQNALKAEDYGITTVPLADKGTAGVLGGGSLAVVRAKSSAAVVSAGVKWIDFYYLSKLTAQDQAVADAKTTAESSQAVGSPELPVFDRALHDQRRQWIAQYVNVPVQQMKPYTDRMFAQPLVPEPTRSTQQVYALLDPVVQAVLTDRNADATALLAQAESQAQALLDRK